MPAPTSPHPVAITACLDRVAERVLAASLAGERFADAHAPLYHQLRPNRGTPLCEQEARYTTRCAAVRAHNARLAAAAPPAVAPPPLPPTRRRAPRSA